MSQTKIQCKTKLLSKIIFQINYWTYIWNLKVWGQARLKFEWEILSGIKKKSRNIDNDYEMAN